MADGRALCALTAPATNAPCAPGQLPSTRVVRIHLRRMTSDPQRRMPRVWQKGKMCGGTLPVVSISCVSINTATRQSQGAAMHLNIQVIPMFRHHPKAAPTIYRKV